MNFKDGLIQLTKDLFPCPTDTDVIWKRGEYKEARIAHLDNGNIACEVYLNNDSTDTITLFDGEYIVIE